MSWEEWHRWILYRRKYGISVHRGIEHGAALISRSIAGGKYEDYLPQRGDPVPEEPATIEQAMAIMPGTVVRR